MKLLNISANKGGGVVKLIVINEEVTACEECVHCRDDYEGMFTCRHPEFNHLSRLKVIPDVSTIPTWCPMPEAPSPVERRCGTCKWWGSELVCHVPIPPWANGCVLTGESEGRDCHTWAAKE